ncbi:MAG: helix-turn-helix domain-containing protein [Deltaproteobacteria bacterium]|nr:helix-turn-helix domain-containing protein [Deltaproteobacteria bacterium]
MSLNVERAVAVCVQYFLRTLMRLERERYGWSAKEAAQRAKWPPELWRSLEQHELPLEPHHWINICTVLELSDDRLARRLDAFVEKNPVLLVAEDADARLDVYEKKLTTPRLLRSKQVFTLNLSPVRVPLYDILSLYVLEGETLIQAAAKKGFYQNKEAPPLKPSFKLQNTHEKLEIRRKRLARYVTEKIEDEKLDALEAALELIASHELDEVHRAVQVVSLALKST